MNFAENLRDKLNLAISQTVSSRGDYADDCQRICREIEIPQKPGNKYRYEIDKTMLIYLAKRFFRDPDFTGEKLIHDIKRYTVPVRPGRADERNLKVKTFPGFPYRIPS